MSNLTNYFLNLLIKHNVDSITFENRYQTKTKNILWDETEVWRFGEPVTKFCLFGGHQFNSHTFDYYVSTKPTLTGNAIRFQYIFQKSGKYTIDIDQLKKSNSNALDKFIESIFLQILTMSEKQNIYFKREILIKRNSAYEHIIQADLNENIYDI